MKKLLLMTPLLFATHLYGQIINAASCSATDVQNAFNSVVNSTTTVNIPAGTCPWTTQVTLNVPSGNTNLSIIGAGNLGITGGNDQTVITDNFASGNDLLVINTNSTPSGVVRLAGITIQPGSGSVKFSGFVGLNGLEQFRFDHSHLNTSGTSGTAGMRLNGCIYGVADHNIIDGSGVNNGIQEYNQGSCYGDSLGLGDQAWAHPTLFGSANAFYLENNVFNNGFANDCTLAGSFVMRYNTFNMSGGNEVIQTHPTGGAGRWRGCRQWEIYGNTFNYSTSTPTFMNAAIWASAGTGIVWGNTSPSSSANGGTGAKQFVELISMRRNNGTYSQFPTPNGWGYCGTDSGLPGAGSAWDQNLIAASGHHCIDQPGTGMGDFITGGFTFDGSGTNNVCDQTVHGTGANCGGFGFGGNWLNEAVEPVIEVDNAYSCVPSNPCVRVAVTASDFTANADFYGWCDPTSASGASDYCPSFTGATGTGSGTLASAPATCTNGTYYFATDKGSWNTSGVGGQGQLYKCSSNTWVLFYTPYSMPHPLVSGGPTLYSWTPTTTNGSLSGTNCAPSNYASGTVIGPCTAVPNSGYVFTGWSSPTGNAACSGSTNPCPLFTILSNSSVVATFNPTTYTLTTTATNGGVTGSNCGSGTYAFNTSIGACTATPNTGYSFTGWSGTGACSGVSGTGTASCTLTSNSTLVAAFTINTYTLSTLVNPNPAGTITGCTGTYNFNAAYSCTITTNSGYVLSSVTGCGGTLSGSTYSGTMGAANCTVTANFNSTGINPPANFSGKITIRGVSKVQ